MNIYMFICVSGIVFFASIADSEMKRKIFAKLSAEKLKKLICGTGILQFGNTKRGTILVYAKDAAAAAETILTNTGKSAKFVDISDLWICHQVLTGQNEFLVDMPAEAKLEDVVKYRELIPDLCDKECYIATTTFYNEGVVRVSFVRAETQHKAMHVVQNRLSSKYNSVVYWC